MKKFILTVGPSLLNAIPINKIHNEKNIYRINGAHGSVEDIEKYVLKIREQIPNADILMDLPGNKVRTKNILIPIKLVNGETFNLSCDNFNYTEFYKHLNPGMTAWANDSVFEFEIKEINDKNIKFISKSNGFLLDNKGIHVRGIHNNIPFFIKSFNKSLIKI